jgi:glutaredoxin
MGGEGLVMRQLDAHVVPCAESPQLDQRADGDAIQDALQQITGGRSVPRVFVDGTFIGGGDDTVSACMQSCQALGLL